LWNNDDYDAAAEYLHSALALDPQFAAAWAKLALLTIWQFDLHASLPQAACADARADADRALNSIRPLVERIVRRQLCSNTAIAISWRRRGNSGGHSNCNPAAQMRYGPTLGSRSRMADLIRHFSWRNARCLGSVNAMNLRVGERTLGGGHFAEAEVAYRKAVET